MVKIDVTAYIDGVHGDNCATFFCGDVDEDVAGCSPSAPRRR